MQKVVCDYCNGIKYIRYDVPVDAPQFGKLYPCPRCNQEQITASSGLLASERDLRLTDLVTKGRDGTAKMLAAAKQVMQARVGMLAICGEYGTGKSSVLKAIVAEMLTLGIEARYITMSELLAYAREAFDSAKSGDTDMGRLSKIAGLPVVCVDECDKARLSDYAREMQTYFFDVRYRNESRMLTVAAWNGSPADLGLPSVVSRFSEFKLIQNWDSDMRPLLGGG